MTMPDTSSFLLGGSSYPSLKFDAAAKTEHTLTITEHPEMRQQTEYVPGGGIGELLWWDKAQTQPKMQMVVTGTVDESERTSPDDDLTRRLYIKGQMQKAVGEAVREAGASDIKKGAKLWIKCTGTERQKSGYDAKVYTARYKAPEGGATADFLAGTARNPGGNTVVDSTAKADDSAPPF